MSRKIVHPEKIPIMDGSELLDKAEAQQLFRDLKGKTTIVYGEHQAISDAATLSDIHYLNDITVLPKAIRLMGPLILELAELRHYRGLEVSVLASIADDKRAKATSPLSSTDLGGILDDLIETTSDETEVRKQTD